jgi:hypothetical protein
MPSYPVLFNLQNFFGQAVHVSVGAGEYARQETGYPGASGVESTSLGSRGKIAVVTGRLRAPSVDDLAALEVVFEAYYESCAQGASYPFQSTTGRFWALLVHRADIVYETGEVIPFDPYREWWDHPGRSLVEEYHYAGCRMTAQGYRQPGRPGARAYSAVSAEHAAKVAVEKRQEWLRTRDIAANPT